MAENLLVPIRLANPLLHTEHPTHGVVMAASDTGYTGFMLIPRAVFRVTLVFLGERPVLSARS